jgi:hypothetical protein
MVVLNALWTNGDDRIALSHPGDPIGDLLTANLDAPDTATVRFEQGLLTYGDNRDAVELEHGEQAFAELPDRASYGRALAASGLVDLANREEVDAFLRRHGYADLAAGHHPVATGLDTNIMAWNVPGMLGIDPDEHDGPEPAPIDAFALSEGVKDELQWRYTHDGVEPLVDAFGEEYRRFDGQPAGDNREGFLGLHEFRRLRDRPSTDVIAGERGDEAIVEAYRHYDDESRKDLVLFSNDRGFIERAVDAGLDAQHLEFPIDIEHSVETDWDTVADLLYTLALVFGVLRLPRVTLYGVWDGKTSEDWRAERIDVECRSQAVEPWIRRDQGIMEPGQI